MSAPEAFKTIDGIRLRRSDFAYAPSGDPNEWKLPVDARHVEAALEMFAHADLPDDSKRAVAERIARAAAEHGLSKHKIDRFRRLHCPAKITARALLPVLLTGPGALTPPPQGIALRQAEAHLREIAVAVSGSWVKSDQDFSITPRDLGDMVSNFRKRKNDMVVIDYEHASETPEVAKGGPVPAAGWIHDLRIHRNGADRLVALVEWTPEAEQMIQTGEYRFFSPAIDWGANDKETGQPQGATLTSGALTNHPFLEELPPIMLSDGKVVAAGLARIQNRCGITPPRPEGVRNMKKMTLKPIPEGEEQGGNHAVYEEGGEQPVGFIPHSELAEYAAKHLGVNPDQEEDAEDSLESGAGPERRDLTIAAREAQRRDFLLREAVRKGKIDTGRAAELAETGKITLAEYIRAQEAEKLIETAIAAGKILPRDRAFFFRDALDRPKEFQDYFRNAAPVVKLGTKGIGCGESLPIDEEVHLGAKRLMSETGMDYAKALKEFLSSNPALEAQYRLRHTRPLATETAAQ